jgi:hypothetical protein
MRLACPAAISKKNREIADGGIPPPVNALLDFPRRSKIKT